MRTVSDSTFYSSGNRDILTVFFFFSSHNLVSDYWPFVFPSRLCGFVFIRCIEHLPLTYLSKLSKSQKYHDENFIVLSFPVILSINSYIVT